MSKRTAVFWIFSSAAPVTFSLKAVEQIENDTLFIVVNEDLYEAAEYTEALMYTGCMVEIAPEVSDVVVKNTGGFEFKQIENSPEQSGTTNSRNALQR